MSLPFPTGFEPTGLEAPRPDDLGGIDLRDHATGDGQADDTGAIQEAIDKAALDGARFVNVAPGLYKVTGPIILKSGVRIHGWAAPMGYGNTNPITGAVILPYGVGYDVFSTPAGAQVRGSGIEDIGFSGSTGPGNWLIRIGDAVGVILRNIAARQFADGANGILLDGEASGVYQTVLDNLSFNCGLGHLGGDAIKLGATSIANFNYGRSLAALGYAVGLHFNRGAGNTVIGSWQQFCTVGILFGATICVVKGGWLEANGTAIQCGPTSILNVLEDVRNAGGHTVALVDDQGTKNIIRVNDYPSTTAAAWKASAHQNVAQTIADSTSTKLVLPGVDVNDGNYDPAAYTYTVPSSGGTYKIAGRVELSAAATRCLAQVYKNGAEVLRGVDGTLSSTVAGNIQAARGDVLELRCFQVSGGPAATIPGVARTYLHVEFESY